MLSGFSPRSILALGPRKVRAASCSLGTGAVLVVAGTGNQLQTCSPLGRRRMGTEKALCAQAPPPHLSPARAHLRKGTKLVSGSCILESEALLGKPSSAPMRVCSGKQRFLVSLLAHCSPYVLGGSGLPPAPWALVHGWWSWSWKPTPNVLYFRENADGA